LTFTSVTALDPEKRQLLISERHQLIEEGAETISCFGAYDPGVAVGATDRLVVVAQRWGAA